MPPVRTRHEPPLRTRRQLARLGFACVLDYTIWCQKHGFSTSLDKAWEALEQEWCVRSEELREARRRERDDRDPVAMLALVAAGQRVSADFARPRWRTLAERIERARLDAEARLALRRLLECGQRRSNMVIAEGQFGDERLPFLQGLIGLARRHRAWVRGPVGWKPRSRNARRQFIALARHLLAHYPVPAFLDAAWLREDPAAAAYQEWYLRAARGESLAGAPGPISLSRRVAHHLLRTTQDLTIEQAIRRAQVIALGGDECLANALLGSRIGSRFENEDFWRTVIAWFIDRPDLDRVHVGPVVDYLHHVRFVPVRGFRAPGVRDAAAALRPHLTMRGRSAATLLREVEEWHQALGRGPGARNVEWSASGIREGEWEVGRPGRDLCVWRVHELVTGVALHAEGRLMRHCVSTYVGACRAGRCSIWSLEREAYEGTEKRLTIEVNASRTIVQCRGRANRRPRADEVEILRRWAREAGLAFANHLGLRA